MPRMSTKSRRADERPVPAVLNRYIDLYLKESRPVLLGSMPPTNALWISSTTGRRMTAKNLGILISKITLETLGVDVSPHLFRTAAASTAAAYGGNTPHLASALLNHYGSASDRRALQSSKQCECRRCICAYNLRNSKPVTFVQDLEGGVCEFRVLRLPPRHARCWLIIPGGRRTGIQHSPSRPA